MQKIAARVVRTLIVLVIVHFVLMRPAEAAHYVHGWFSGVNSAANSVSRLLSALRT